MQALLQLVYSAVCNHVRYFSLLMSEMNQEQEIQKKKQAIFCRHIHEEVRYGQGHLWEAVSC